MSSCADYTIDENLYNRALREIYDDFMAKHPVRSELACQTIEQNVRQHAKNTFSTIWHNVVQMNEHHKAGLAKRTPSAFGPFDEKMYHGMKPEFIERLRKSHEKTRATFEASAARQNKMSEDFHRDLLLVSFVGMRGAETGISKSTADKIVDEWILPRLAK